MRASLLVGLIKYETITENNLTNITSTKKTANIAFNECILTGGILNGSFSPLRLWIENDTLNFDLSTRHKARAIYLDTDFRLLQKFMRTGESFTPPEFHGKIPTDFISQVKALYQKKTFEALGFMLKSHQAVIGRRAIDRALSGATENQPLAILKTSIASEAICKNFKFKQKSLHIIDHFPEEILQKISGREKISFYCVLDTQMGKLFVNDYKKYLQIMGE